MSAEPIIRDEIPETVERLTRDLARAARTLSVREARYLVDAYYQMQDYRIISNNQRRAMGDSEEPHLVLDYHSEQMTTLERQVQRALAAWADSKPLGRWCQSIVGIGPVLTAGLMAHIDIKQAPTVGHIWRFAGLDPTVTWNRGEKRPWNGALKTLCWKIGESFVKVSGNERDTYGKVYKTRKAFEEARNERGDNAETAKLALERKRWDKSTEAYKALSVGKLPQAQLHARAKRYSVKLFLSHYQYVGYELEFEEPPPKPYILTQPGHVHFVAPPNWPMDLAFSTG